MPIERVIGFGTLLLIACSLAWFAPGSDRRDARVCVILQVVSWLVYITSWSPYRLIHLLYVETGLYMTSPQLWAVMDCLTATMIMGLYARSPSLWRIGLVVNLLAQCGLHVTNLNIADTNFAVYTHTLDALWFVQLMCLVSAGRGGYDSDWLFHSRDTRFRDHDYSSGTVRSGSPH